MKKLILAALLVCALPLRAQEETDPRQMRLAELSAIAPENRTSDQNEEAVLLSFSLLVNRLMEDLPESDKAKLAGLHTVISTVDESSPVIIQGKEIRVSAEYLGTLHELISLLTHDLSVTRFETFEVPNPLLDQPFAVSALVPLMKPLRTHLDSPFFWDVQSLISCPPSDADCRDLSLVSLAALLSFVFSHEISHVLLDHPKKPSLEEEIAADAKAWPLTQRLLSDFSTKDPDFDEVVRLAFLAGPLLSLEYQLFDEKGQEIPGIARRRDALLARIPGDLREEVAGLLFPQRSAENIGRLELRWDHFPQRLWIDGIEIPPSEVRGQELLVADGQHRIFAWSEEGLAAYERVHAGGTRRMVFLRFRRIVEAPAPLGDLQALQRERRWFDLLLHTSDAALKVRDNHFLLLHAEALRFMSLPDLIEIPPEGALSAAERRKLQSWKRSGSPLLSWW